MYSMPDWAYAKEVEVEEREGQLVVVFPEPLTHVTLMWNIPATARFNPAVPLQAYIFTRMLYGAEVPVYGVNETTVLAYSEAEAWIHLLQKNGDGVQSDWSGPEVKPLQAGILNEVLE